MFCLDEKALVSDREALAPDKEAFDSDKEVFDSAMDALAFDIELHKQIKTSREKGKSIAAADAVLAHHGN